MTKFSIAALVTAVTLAATAASALSFNEAVSGDLADTPTLTDTGTNIGTLDLGLNTVEGSLSASCGFSFGCFPLDGDTSDTFSFNLASGTFLSAATITIFETSSFPLNGLWMTDGTDLNAILFSAPGIYDLLAGGVTGEQLLRIAPNGAFLSGGAIVDADYRVDLSVASQVPLPAGLPLMLTVLIGMGALAARRRKAA